MLIDEYRTSLKHPEAEEVFDLIAFRPMGFVLAKAVRRTPLSPNHVTTVSLLFGVAAALAFSQGTQPAYVWGALLYAVANLLDCTDGQLARLQRSGTLLGRIWDGIADYIATVAVFLGIGLVSADWWLVAVAGLSSAVHAALFDYYQSAFMAAIHRTGDFLQNERHLYEQELQKHQKNKIKLLFVRIYLWYLWIQRGTTARVLSQQSISNGMIRLWSFLGPTTNRTILIISALFGNVEFFVWTIVVAGNVWMLVCILVQKRIQG